MKYWREVLLGCALLTVTIALSGCGAGAKYVLVAGKPGMTDSEYASARDYCITMTDGASYSQKFRFMPGQVAPPDAPRTHVGSRYAACMESKGYVCLNCRRSFQSIPESSLKSGSN